jgi:hypothetical protein
LCIDCPQRGIRNRCGFQSLVNCRGGLSVPSVALHPVPAFAQATSRQGVMKEVAPLPKAQIFVAREIITTDPNRPRAEVVAVVGDRIAAMRSRSELEALAAPQRYLINDTLAAKVLFAGFVGKHVHPVLGAQEAASEQ